jgi:hypothetical protein
MGASASLLEGKSDSEREELVARFQILQLQGLDEAAATKAVEEGYLFIEDKSCIFKDILEPAEAPTEWALYKDRGISLAVALDWMRVYIEKDATTKQAAMRMKEDTLCFKCPGYILFSNVKVGKDKKPAVGKPTAFISHPWSVKISDTLSAAENYCAINSIDPEDFFIWMDIFCLNQHVEIPNVGISETDLAKCFIDCIAQSSKVLCFCDTLVDVPATFTRCWCLWEVYTSLVKGAKFDVIITPEAKARLDDATRDKFPEVVSKLQAIQSKEAKAYSPNDADMIKGWIQDGRKDLNMPAAGFDKLDGLIRNAVQEYLCSSNSDYAVEITFKNTHTNPVDIIWQSFQGEDTFYRSLSPGESYLQPSYATHPWKIVDQETKEVLKIFVATVGQREYFVDAVGMASHVSHDSINIIFVNNLPGDRKVEVRWIDFNNCEVPYYTLNPGESYSQQSYLTHPWKIYDVTDGGNRFMKTFVGNKYDNKTNYTVMAD